MANQYESQSWDDPNYNGFLALWGLLKERSLAPVMHPTYWIFIFLGVGFFGGLGIWYEAYKILGAKQASLDSLKTAFFTFPPAILGAAVLQFIFEENGANPLRAFSMFVFALVCVALLISIKVACDGFYFFVATICSLIALWMFWVVNATNRDLRDRTPTNAATGGDPLLPPAGEIPDGFTV
jgi:hypothetical protein